MLEHGQSYESGRETRPDATLLIRLDRVPIRGYESTRRSVHFRIDLIGLGGESSIRAR